MNENKIIKPRKKFKLLLKIIIFFIFPIFLVYIWFSGLNYIHQIDAWFMLNPEKQMNSAFFAIEDGISLGNNYPNFQVLILWIWQVALMKIYEIMTSYWNALVLSEMTLYYLTLSFGMLFAYIFFKEFYINFLNKEKTEGIISELILIAISFIYILNQFTLTMIFYRFTAWTILWISMPLISYFFLKYVRTKKFYLMIILGIILTLTPINSISSIGVFPVVFLLLCLLSFISILNNKDKGVVKRILISFILIHLFLAASLIPQIISIKTISESSQVILGNNNEFLDYSSQFTSIINTTKFLGYYVLSGAIPSKENFPFSWIKVLENPIFKIISNIYFIVIALGILFLLIEKDDKKKKIFLVFIGMLFIMIFFMKGENKPFSIINTLLLSISSVFFRHPHERFVHLYSFIFFIIFLYNIYNLEYKLKNKLISNLLIIILIFGIITTSIYIYTPNAIFPSDKIDLTKSEYLKLKNNPNIDENKFLSYRSLILPFSINSSEFSYKFAEKIHHPNDKSIIYNMINNIRIIQYPKTNYDNLFLLEVYDSINNKNKEKFLDLCIKSNTQFIVVNKDASTTYLMLKDNIDLIEKYKGFIEELRNEKLIEEIMSTNEISIYRINIEPKQLLFGNASFQKINPTKYRVYIENLNSKQGLIFLESFHPGWVLFLKKHPTDYWCSPIEFYNNTNTTECEHTQKFFEGEELDYLFEKPIFDRTHETAYDYANSWTLDPQYIKDNYSDEYYTENKDGSINIELVMYFRPQSYFYVGILISAGTLIICILTLIISKILSLRKRKIETY